MEKLKLNDLENMDWKKAVIVFTEDSFREKYSLESRSYEIRSDAKYFNESMLGNSLYGNALDGSDDGVRLDWYIKQEVDKWNIDYCYITE